MLLFTATFKPPLERLQRVVQRVRKINTLFLLTVVLPVTLATIYFGLVASDVYVSESRFVVRSQQRQPASSVLGEFLAGAGAGRAQDEAYSVQDYILSRDALHQLDERLALRKAFGDKGIDVLSRFPGLDWDDSFEALYRYYPKRVTVAYDPTSAITTLKVSAFNAQDARRINEQLLSMSEALVNQLNKRAAEDSVRFASGLVEEAEQKAKAAALAMSTFRSRSSVFDPEKQSTIQLQGVAKLQEELIATKTQLAQVRGLSATNPQIGVLEARVITLQKEIDAETRKVAGGGPSLSSRVSEYARLELERGFAEKQLSSALTSLEMARSDAQKKQLYL